MKYKFKCRNCDEFLYIETVSEKNTEYNCSNCGVFNVVSKEGHWMDGKWHEMEILDNDGSTAEVGKQPTNISTSVSIALSNKYSILKVFQILLWISIVLYTISWFLITFTEAVLPMPEALITLPVFILVIFFHYCTIKIIDFLFDLDKKTDN